MSIAEIISNASEKRASDIHICCGLPVKIRVDGRVVDYDSHVLTHDECEKAAAELAAAAGEMQGSLEECGEADFAGSINGQRIRCNIFRQQGHASAAVRLLHDGIPVFDKLGLPEAVRGFADYKRGIVLVTGETGSGKTTTLAALLDMINHNKEKHIITLEDPIEYVYSPDKCVISQREIGRDTLSYDSGMKAILREDPDVILIGEMRSLDTIETALTAAETGHLVFSTLHTNSAADAVDRIVSVFPGERQQQIRLQLSMTLKAVLSQQLLPRANKPGRALACEVMVVNAAIRNLIREGKTPQINSSILTSGQDGGQLMDNAIIKLYQSGEISLDTVMSACQDPDYMKTRTAPAADQHSFMSYGSKPQGVNGLNMQPGKPQRGLFK